MEKLIGLNKSMPIAPKSNLGIPPKPSSPPKTLTLKKNEWNTSPIARVTIRKNIPLNRTAKIATQNANPAVIIIDIGIATDKGQPQIAVNAAVPYAPVPKKAA